MDNRKPMYGTNHHTRIVSRPNGLWRAERRIAERGTREHDCWEATSRDTSKDEALRLVRD